MRWPRLSNWAKAEPERPDHVLASRTDLCRIAFSLPLVGIGGVKVALLNA